MGNKRREARKALIQSFYEEYLTLRQKGISHDEAMVEFEYLPAMTRAQLTKHIGEHYVEQFTKKGEPAVS